MATYTIDKLVTELELDSSKYSIGLRDAKGQMVDFERVAKTVAIGIGAITAAGAAVATSLAVVTKQTMDQGDKFDKLSQKIGINVERLSAYEHVANLSGISLEGMAGGVKRLAQNMNDAAQGVGEGKKAFEQLGISVVGSNGKLKSADEMMLEIADKISHMDDKTKKIVTSMDLLGKSGADLIPMFNGGAESIKNMLAEGTRLRGWTEGEAKMAAELSDNLTRLTAGTKGYEDAIGKELIPAANAAVEVTNEWLAANDDLLKNGIGKIPGIINDYVIPSFFTMMKSMNDVKTGFGLAWDAINIKMLDSVKKEKGLGKFFADVVVGFKALGIAFTEGGQSARDFVDNYHNTLSSKKTKEILDEMINEHITSMDNISNANKDLTEKLEGLQEKLLNKIEVTQKKRKEVTVKTDEEILNSNKILTEAEIKLLEEKFKNIDEKYKNAEDSITKFYSQSERYSDAWYDNEMYCILDSKREYLDAIDEMTISNEDKARMRVDVANWEDDQKKRIHKEILRRQEKETEETTGLYAQLYHDTKEYSDEYYEFESEKINLQKRQYINAGVDKNLADKWAANEYKKLEKEKTMASNNFFGGMKEGYNDLLAHQYTFSQAGYDTFKGMTDNMSSTFSSFGNDLFNGELKSMQDYMQSFAESMVKMWIDMVAKMIAQWVMLQAATALGFGGGGIGGVLGSTASSAMGSSFGSLGGAAGGAAISSALGGTGAATAGGAITTAGGTTYMMNVPAASAATGASLAATLAVAAPLAVGAVILSQILGKKKDPGMASADKLKQLGYPDAYVADWVKRYPRGTLPTAVPAEGRANLDLWPTAQAMGALDTKTWTQLEIRDEILRAKQNMLRAGEKNSYSDSELMQKLGFYVKSGFGSKSKYGRVLHDQGGYISPNTGLYADNTHRWIAVTPGEAVLSPSTTTRVGGEAGVNRLNTGAAGGTTIINNIYTNAIFSNEQDLLGYIDKGLHKLHQREYR